MNRAIIVVLTVVLAATLLAAQTQPPSGTPQGTKPGTQQGTPQGTKPGQGTPQGVPAGQAGGQGQGQPAAQAPAGPRPPQAKSQEEYAAYQTAAAINDAAQLEAAANEFATKYPNSELRALLYEKDLSLYQNANNADKVIEVGRKILGTAPENAAAMVTVANALASSTRKTDLDAAEKWAEASKDVNQALDLLQNGKGVPIGIPEANLQPYKHLVMSMAYAALGTIEFNKENYTAAEQNLRKSVDFSDIAQDPVSWVQLAVALDKQNKYAEALQVAEQCVALPGQSTASELCKQEAARLRKLTGSPAGQQKPPTAKPQTPQPPQ